MAKSVLPAARGDEGKVQLKYYNTGSFTKEEIGTEQIIITRHKNSLDYHQDTQEDWPTSPPARLKDKHVTAFIKKLNQISIKKIGLTENSQRSPRWKKGHHPQMKTGIEINEAEYVPQRAFTARYQPKSGEVVQFEKCVSELQDAKPTPSFFIGAAGSGKTTLLKSLAKEFITSNELNVVSKRNILEKCFGCCSDIISDFDIVYLVNVGQLPDLQQASLAQVLFNPSVTQLSVDEAQHGLQAILQGEIRIIMLLDGLDEATWRPQHDDVIGHWDNASTATIFGNILSGHLLSTVPIIVSSTEHSVACLTESMRPNSITALVRFREQDAEEIYCDTMGEGAAKDWNDLKSEKPRMIFMCLTPMFLTFYMIAKMANPNLKFSCASEVLVTVIRLLLRAENFNQNDVIIQRDVIIDVINKLKALAFHGMTEQRISFENEDLIKFGIRRDMINDIVIKIDGKNDRGLKILQGVHRYSFIHQSLQEMLAAIHVAEKPLEDFKAFMDGELDKESWDVVTSFLFAILKNQKVRNGIPPDILNVEHLEEKCDYLKIKIALQLRSNLSPIRRLDLLVALSEASATEMINQCTETLDFSNTPMNPELISLLITALKRIDRLPLLSLATCGINDELLTLLSTRHSRSGRTVQIETLDMSGNLSWTSTQLWRRLFDRMSIQRCRLDIPNDQGADAAYESLVKIANAGRDSGVSLECRVVELRLSLDQVKELSRHEITLQIGLLLIKGDVTRMNFLSVRHFLQRHSMKQCHLGIHQDEKSGDFEFVVQLVESTLASNTSQLQIQKLKINQSQAARQLDGLTRFNKRLKILELMVHPSNERFDDDFWRRMFAQIIVDKCVISSVKKDCVDIWLKYGNAAKNGNVRQMVLVPDAKLGLKFKEFVDLSRKMPSEVSGTITKLKIRVSEGYVLTASDWTLLGDSFKRFNMKKLYCENYSEFPDLKSFAKELQNIQFKQFRLAWKTEDDNIMYFSTTRDDGDQIKIMYVNSGQERLIDQSYAIGKAINTLRIKDVVFGTIDGSISIKLFLSGLGNARIETLASMDLDLHELQAIFIQCEVKRLQILTNDNTKMKAIIASRDRLRNTGSHETRSTDDGQDKFLTEEQWTQLFGLSYE